MRWNPTLAHRTRKDGAASVGPGERVGQPPVARGLSPRDSFPIGRMSLSSCNATRRLTLSIHPDVDCGGFG